MISNKPKVNSATQDTKSLKNEPTETSRGFKQDKLSPLHDANLTSLSDLPSEELWLANARTKSSETARYYKTDLDQFKDYFRITNPADYRSITAKHIIQYRIYLQFGSKYKVGDEIPKNAKPKVSNGTVARKLSSVSSLFTFFCQQGSMRANPFKVIKRPSVTRGGKSKILTEAEARKILALPPADTLVGKRDRAILSTFLYGGLRRQELCNLKVNSIFVDKGVMKFRIQGKGQKERDVPISIATVQAIHEYLQAAGHKDNPEAPLFLPLANYKDNEGNLKHFTGDGIYKIVMAYAEKAGIDLNNFHPHSFRATGASNALENGASLPDVQNWLGHADISTTRIYLRPKEDDAKSPSFKISY